MKAAISFVGRHNAGKTTLLTQLITYLKQQGLKIAFIKHTHHDHIALPGKDSELALQAGADVAAVISPLLSIRYQRYETEPSLEQILESVPADIDLIIVEGFKKEDLPKVEVLRQAIDPVPMLLPRTVALAADFSLECGLPVIAIDDVEALAQFVCHFCQL
ncbi:MAG TPA: molybdopterin-guanine dinucleotide biosynthesis protein B [Syntrophomonadaceae bacterium]|jgi:molybdopterin-guanine dinucleotide biosynthesis protein B|nr:molybdopterin-guanine dinucleotide biosynthesis protein B [Syntrophomonadaceae bacterium]